MHRKTLYYRLQTYYLGFFSIKLTPTCSLLFQAREEVFHAQLVAMSTQSGPGSQSSDLLDDSELMTDDRELDADLVGKWTSLLSIFTVEFVFNNIIFKTI